MSSAGFYNGFGPAERDGTLARVRAALADGTLAQPSRCSVCGEQPGKPLGFHSERYDPDVLDVYPVCRRCHYAIHIRFHRPAYWLAHIARLDPAGWFQRLSLDPLSLTRPYAETYPDGLGPPIKRPEVLP